MLRLATQAAAIACALLVLPAGAGAQTYPTRPITLIVTFPPGASSDIVARTLEPGVSAELGQSLVVENRPGAGGNIGIGAVAKARRTATCWASLRQVCWPSIRTSTAAWPSIR